VSESDPLPADGATRTADEAWDRVRRLAQKVGPEGFDPGPERAARRMRAIEKAERATRRAMLADQVEEALRAARAARDARVEGGVPGRAEGTEPPG
jgi:hypothetical protein